MKEFARTLFLISIPAALIAQPSISYRGVVNTASLAPAGLPGGAIARGSVFSIYGARLGPAQSVQAASFPLSNTLAGVSITLTQGTSTLNAIPIFVRADQINAIMPSNAPLGKVALRVIFNNSPSFPSPVEIKATNFGIFTANGGGSGPGILQNFIAADNQPVNSLLKPAIAGQTITLWGTGLGAVTGPDNVAPAVGNLPTQTEVFVGGKSARIAYSGRTPCCSGIDQIVFQVPADAPAGCWVPVYVRTGGTNVSNFVTMAISADGNGCVDSANALSRQFRQGGKVGLVLPTRTVTMEDIGTQNPVQVTTDFVGVNWTGLPGGEFSYQPPFSLPPPGTCHVYTAPGNILAPGGFSWLPYGTPLDAAGPVVLGAGGASVKLGTPPKSDDFLFLHVGASATGMNFARVPRFSPGSFTVSGGGGADVGTFQAAFSMAAPLTWTGRDQVGVVDRTQPFTINWSGRTAGSDVFALGASVDLSTNSSAAFLCLAGPDDNTLTIPAAVLSTLPATRVPLRQSRAILYLGQWTIASPVPFDAAGLDQGVAIPVQLSGKTVVYR